MMMVMAMMMDNIDGDDNDGDDDESGAPNKELGDLKCKANFPSNLK